MTTKQLQSLLRQANRQLASYNRRFRWMYTDRFTGNIVPRSVAMEVAKTDMLLAKMRRAVARPKTVRKAK